MATRTEIARLANYSHEFGKASHIFLKNGLWWITASPCKSAWWMSMSLASHAKVFGKCGLVWRVLRVREYAHTRQSAHDKVCCFRHNNIFYMYKTVYPLLAKFAILNKFAKFEAFGQWEYSPKVQKFWRVLALPKFTLELPLLSYNTNLNCQLYKNHE